MIKTTSLPEYHFGMKPNPGYVYQNEANTPFPRTPDFHIQTLHCPFRSGTFRSSDFRHIASLKEKKEQAMKSKQTKSILKNSQNTTLPEPQHQKLDVTKIQCMLKKRKNLANENLLNRSHQKNEKKVKFDDKLNRLEEIGMKYKGKISPENKIPNETTACVRHQKKLAKMTTKNSEKRDLRGSIVNISTVYDFKEDRPMSPRSLTKSTSSGSLQVQDRRSSLTSLHNNHSNDDFMHMDIHEQTPIPTYNTRFSNYIESDRIKQENPDDVAVCNTQEKKLVERGIPLFSRSGRYIRPSEIVNVSQNKRSEASEGSVKPTYRLPFEISKGKEIDTIIHISSGQRRFVNKTTTNTCSGATVTRTHVRPFMFSRLQQEPEVAKVTPPDHDKNYCDDGKTYQIMRWLKDVSEVQAKEGFCTLISDGDV